MNIVKKTFVRTKDQKTAELLEKNGFTFISKEGNIYTFLNDGVESFELKGKIVFTNILNV
mgnify:FL=1